MPSITYPLDTTGLSPGNLIINELHTLTEVNSNTYRVILPFFSPFYLDNFTLTHIAEDGSSHLLVPDVDYIFCLPFIGATRSIGKMLYGGVSINTDLIDGVLSVNYQTLGDKWVADKNYVLERLAELVYNPRIVTWDCVTNVQDTFPPTIHSVDIDNIYGQDKVLDALGNIVTAITVPPTTPQALLSHLLDDNNPHVVTKEQIGLGLIQNLSLATSDDIDGLNNVNKYITLDQLVTILRRLKVLN